MCSGTQIHGIERAVFVACTLVVRVMYSMGTAEATVGSSSLMVTVATCIAAQKWGVFPSCVVNYSSPD